jgi:hypothetical protein
MSTANCRQQAAHRLATPTPQLPRLCGASGRPFDCDLVRDAHFVAEILQHFPLVIWKVSAQRRGRPQRIPKPDDASVRLLAAHHAGRTAASARYSLRSHQLSSSVATSSLAPVESSFVIVRRPAIALAFVISSMTGVTRASRPCSTCARCASSSTPAKTRQPNSESRLAHASPMPDPAPVTNAEGAAS